MLNEPHTPVKSSKPRTPSGSLPAAVKLMGQAKRIRALKRKLNTVFKHANALIDRELERIVA